MIDVQDLSFTYPGAAAGAVDGVCFDVPTGSIFGLLGPSGAGKSTIQKILIKLLPMQRGSVRFDGAELRALGRDFFEQVGVSFEHPNLFPKLSGMENLEAFAGLYRGPLRDAGGLMQEIGLGDARDKPAAEFSKGMKQRLVFVRALLHSPSFLFLDEPTSGLDPATQEVVMDLIRGERDRGATILLTTHNMRVADTLCDRIGLLNAGKLVACDSPRALKLAHGERALRIERRVEGVLRTETLSPEKAEDRSRLAALLAAGDLETLHSQEATLSDVFIRLTGRGLSA